jgi:hypothetical protein
MNKAFRLILLPFLLCLAMILPAWGRKDKSAPVQEEHNASQQNTVVRVTGTVRLVGSEPFPELVITGTDKQWYIDKDDEHLLKNLQHRTVTVEGIESVIALTFANGLSAGERRMLRNIRIISVE